MAQGTIRITFKPSDGYASVTYTNPSTGSIGMPFQTVNSDEYSRSIETNGLTIPKSLPTKLYLEKDTSGGASTRYRTIGIAYKNASGKPTYVAEIGIRQYRLLPYGSYTYYIDYSYLSKGVWTTSNKSTTSTSTTLSVTINWDTDAGLYYKDNGTWKSLGESKQKIAGHWE